MLRLLVLLVVSYTVVLGDGRAADPACEKLTQYRDTQLFSQWQESFGRWTYFSVALRHTRDNQAMLKSDAAAQERLQLTGAILSSIVVNVRALEAAIDLITVGAAGEVSAIGRLSADHVLKAIKQGKNVLPLFTAENDAEAARLSINFVPVLGSSLKFFKSVEELGKYSQAASVSQAEMNHNVLAVERSLSAIVANVDRLRSTALLANNVREQIDKLCGLTQPRTERVEPDQKPSVVFPPPETPLGESSDLICSALSDPANVADLADRDPTGLARLVQQCKQ